LGAGGRRSAPGPHPSFILVAHPYIFDRTIRECQSTSPVDPIREEAIRMQSITWLDNVRKALRLPIRTFNTAAIYFLRFRLTHPPSMTEFNPLDVAAAALFTACKIEDTLKKSREILCAAYNLKAAAAATGTTERLSPDDPIFESQSRGIIGLERQMLECSGFDFRNRHPQRIVIKLARELGFSNNSDGPATPGERPARFAYAMALDLYRTYAPLKQTSATMAFACLELTSRLCNLASMTMAGGEMGAAPSAPSNPFSEEAYARWNTTRAEVMETMLDLLELYQMFSCHGGCLSRARLSSQKTI
ncbi:RNA polymerase II C-terminal domain kinase beta subunit, partial [Ascosphaera atra]